MYLIANAKNTLTVINISRLNCFELKKNRPTRRFK